MDMSSPWPEVDFEVEPPSEESDEESDQHLDEDSDQHVDEESTDSVIDARHLDEEPAEPDFNAPDEQPVTEFESLDRLQPGTVLPNAVPDSYESEDEGRSPRAPFDDED
jgi:hypothetical protein